MAPMSSTGVLENTPGSVRTSNDQIRRDRGLSALELVCERDTGRKCRVGADGAEIRHLCSDVGGGVYLLGDDVFNECAESTLPLRFGTVGSVSTSEAEAG